WKKAAAYDPARPFQAWAFGFAFQQVRAARQRSNRDRLVLQDDETLEAVSQQWLSSHARPVDDRLAALDRCVEKLPASSRDLVHRHYTLGETLEELAGHLGKRANTLAVTLFRIRENLGKCIAETLANPSA
ncbi:MAG: sigma factor-like helix-turn-helix DNA-binding protein, partial [Verrucomicrobiota bacterium]